MGTHAKLPAEKRKSTTVEAVMELARQQNPHGITTAAIAKHMGVTQGALFRHFESKDAIWQTVMEWVSTHLLERLDRAAGHIASPTAAMEAMFISHIEFVAEHPGVPRMLFGELQRSGTTPAKRVARALISNYRKRLQTLIERGKHCGEILPSIDSEAAAILFVGMVQGLVIQSLLAENVEHMRDTAPSLFVIFRRGIATAP